MVSNRWLCLFWTFALATLTERVVAEDGADVEGLALLAQRGVPSRHQPHRKAIKIPPIVLFNYKFNLLNASKAQLKSDPMHKLVLKNVKHTIALFGGDVEQVHFYDDDQCVKELKKLHQFNGHKLAEGFLSLRHGKYKSDICRLAQLWRYGGYYFDTDILPVKSMRAYLDPDTTFASVRSMCKKEIFQAFLAATPHNELIGENLRIFGEWLQKRQHNSEGSNIGPRLMWGSLQESGSEFKKASHVLTGSQKIQLFQENSIKLWKHGKESISGLMPGHSKWHDCNIAVVDQDTDEVVMYPRVISTMNDEACSEEKKLIVSFLEQPHSDEDS
mmetsp:Transcript_126652/g.300939  ORF Transcript_126652/g.300939 Transcript_126652/m.300939 type:complete len:330 (+) Transcript_126652:55-1044(+)